MFRKQESTGSREFDASFKPARFLLSEMPIWQLQRGRGRIRTQQNNLSFESNFFRSRPVLLSQQAFTATSQKQGFTPSLLITHV